MGIEWRPLRYHGRPPVLSTLLDVGEPAPGPARASRPRRPDVVHVRSYVPALIALAGRRRSGGKLLFDIRGFWADERVEGGIWPAGGRLYRVAKAASAASSPPADAIVTLDPCVGSPDPEVGRRSSRFRSA